MRILRKAQIIALLFLAGCAASTHWHLDSIATGDPAFDSSKLSYQIHQGDFCLEFIHSADEIDGFITAKQFSFQPTAENPSLAELSLHIGEETFPLTLPLYQGNMRLKLPAQMTEKLINALAKDEKVDIVIEDNEQRIETDHFKTIYNKFLKGSFYFNNFFKNPLEE